MKPRFIRRDYKRYSKIGKNRRKLQKWRGAKGRDNKIRLHMKGYPKAPTVGYKKGKIIRQTLIHNLSDLENAKKNTQIILAKVGAIKKLEIIKRADELKIPLSNVKSQEVQK